MKESLVSALEVLLEETAKAHHQEYRDTGGEDPQWASWYADYAHQRIEALLDASFGESELARIFEETEGRRAEERPEADWPRFAAEHFARRFG